MSWDAIAPAEEADKPWEYSDLPKAAVSGGASTVSGLAGLARTYIADTEKGKEVLRQIQRAAGNAQESAEESMTPQGRKLLGANLTSEEFLSHPVAGVVLKTMGMAPGMAASALPGGVIGNVAGRLAGMAATAATSGALGAADIENTIQSEIDKTSDKDLQGQSSTYAGYRADMSERDAKEELTKQMMGWKPAVGFLLGVGSGLYGPTGNIVRGVTEGAARHGVKAAAIEGLTTETAEETYGAYAGQKAEVERGARPAVDLSEVIAQGLTGGVMGGLLGGASGIGGGHGKGKAHGETETTGRGAEDTAIQAPAEAAAPGQPVGVGAETVSAVKAKAKAKAANESIVGLGPAEREAITDLAQPTKPSLRQAAETAVPDVSPPVPPVPPSPPTPDVAQPQQATGVPPPAPVAAPPSEAQPQEPVPTPAPQQQAAPVAPEVTPAPPVRETQQAAPVTPEAPIPTEPAPPVAPQAAPVAAEPSLPQAPSEPVTPTGRVLPVTREEVVAETKAGKRKARTQAQKQAAGDEAPAISHKGGVAEKAMSARATHAKDIVEAAFGKDQKPLTMPENTPEARHALADTLQLTLDKAASHGLVLRENLPEDVRKSQKGEQFNLSIPTQVGHKKMSPHVRYLRELHDVVKTLRDPEGWDRQRVEAFINHHNTKDLEGLAARRLEEGAKLQRDQGDGEAPRAAKIKEKVSTGAASTGRVLTGEEKAALAKQYEQPAKPIETPAEVREKAAQTREPEAKPEPVTPEVTAPKVDYSEMGRKHAEQVHEHIDDYESPREEGRLNLKAVLEQQNTPQEKINAALKAYADTYDKNFTGQTTGEVRQKTPAEIIAEKKAEAAYAKQRQEKRQAELASKRATPVPTAAPAKAKPTLTLGKKKPEIGAVETKLSKLDKVRSIDNGEEATPVETTNVREALKNLDFSHLEGVSKHIAPFMQKTLTDLVGDTPVHFISDADFDRLYGKKTRGTFTRLTHKTQGRIADSGRFISIRESERADPTKAAHSVLHEVTHDAMDRAIDFDANTRRIVDHMMDSVRAHLDANPDVKDVFASQYAMSQPKEFMAEAFSNPEFQDLLARVPVSDALAKALKLTEARPTVWDSLLKTVRGVIEKVTGKLPGNPKMIEAIIRLGDFSAAYRSQRAQHGLIGSATPGRLLELTRQMHGEKALSATQSNLTTNEVLDAAARGAKDVRINTKGGLARAKQWLSSAWSLAKDSAHLFGPSDHTNPLNRLFDARAMMEHEKSKVLKEHNADTVIGNLAKAERAHPELMRELEGVGFDASMHDVNLEGGNDHLGKDKLMGHQAKGEVDRLKALWNDKKFNPIRGAMSDAFKFFRDLHNAVSRATIKNLLAEANIHDEALVDRIHNQGVSEQDAAGMDSNLVRMLSQVKDLKRKHGSFIPFRRFGEFISAGEHELSVPANGTKINDNTIQFIDPRPKNGTEYGDARARAQVKMYLRQSSHTPQGNKLVPAQIRKVWVDRNNPSEIIEPEQANAIPAYRVSMQTEHMDMHATEAEALNNAEALKEAGLTNTRTHKREQAFQNTRGNLQSAMGAVFRSLENQQRYKDADETQRQAMREMFHDLTLGMSGTTSIKNSMRQRRNVAGMSRDLPRVTADYGRMVANHLAMLRHRPTIDNIFGEMRDYMKAHSGKDNFRREEVYQEFTNRIYGAAGQRADEHKPGVITRILQMSRISRLLGPSFHIINAHEPWTTSLPVIGGRHGFVKTARKMMEMYNLIGGRTGLVKSFQDMAKAYTNDNGFTDYPKLFKEAISKNQFMSEEKKQRLMGMIDYMDKRNLLGNSAIFEMGRYADPSGNIAGRALDRIDLMGNQVGTAIEAINRIVTGLTAYDLEHTSNGGNNETAMHYAYSTAHDTMGDYSNWNAAPAFNTGIGRIALQFKKFPHKMYTLLGNIMGGVVRGDPQAMKQFAGLMVTHAMVAGVLGLPTEPFKAALMAANILGVSGFTPDDYEYAVRQLAARVAGQKGGEIISKGLYRGIGVDVSSRLGLSDLLTHGAPKSNKDTDIKSWLFDTMAGAPAGYLLDQVKAAQALMKGDVPGFLEKASPIRAVGDITKAAVGLAGPKKSAAGTTTQEQFSPYQAGIRALGFTPSASSEMGALRGTVARESKRLSSNRSEVIQTWVDASGGDKVDAQRMVQKWNSAHPLKTEQISQSDLANAAKRQIRDTLREKHGVRIDKRSKPIYERAASVFNP